jgi:hypothetical protein
MPPRVSRNEIAQLYRAHPEQWVDTRRPEDFTIDENAQRITVPNRELLPEFHKKFQTRLGYYFGGRSPRQMTVALSQVTSRNFVQNFDFSASEFGIDDPDFGNFTVRSRTNSLEVQRYRNMDLAYNQTLGFLTSEYLRGINVGLTYSRSYANQRRAGTAPHRVSARLGYAYKRFNGTFGMIWAGRPAGEHDLRSLHRPDHEVRSLAELEIE